MAKAPREIDTLTHDAARRINVPTAEMASLFEQQQEILGEGEREMAIPRPRPLANGETRDRDPDLDPQIVWNGAKIRITKEQMRQLAETGELELGDAQLVWRGKDRQDWSDLVVNAPPIYVQEKVHPKTIIDDLKRRTETRRETEIGAPDLFADFNGLTDPEARAEFYQHSQHWTNRFILGDSLQVMASLAEREAMRGKVQCIYFDPPYGIKFNSNWQVSTLSRDVKDGKAADVSREPEQVKAFRDTWKDGIHSYLTYLRDRLMVARELLTESGSIFVQIGDENVHRVRALMDEVFGEENFVSQIAFQKTSSANSPTGKTATLQNVFDYVIWFAKSAERIKARDLFLDKRRSGSFDAAYRFIQHGDGYRRPMSREERDGLVELPRGARRYRQSDLTAQQPTTIYDLDLFGRKFNPHPRGWRTTRAGMLRALKADRLDLVGKTPIYVNYEDDYPIIRLANVWSDTVIAGFASDKRYVVETTATVIERCVLMSTDPGDLVLDPTCGSGTTATVAEQWGRRWITIDTSRVALALARTRLMSARYSYYHLADSPEGRAQEQKVSGKIQTEAPTVGDIRQGFVYERAPHITLKSIANNAEIDVIWERWQEVLEPLRDKLNAAMQTAWEEWEIPRDLDAWLDSKQGQGKAGLANAEARKLHANWWEGRIARQKQIDESIARAADVETLYDRPYEDKGKVRVAGPFTVESLSPHRVIAARDDTLADEIRAGEGGMQPDPKNVPEMDFGQMVLDHLRSAGVHQQEKRDTIQFNSVDPWPGNWLAAEGRYTDGDGREKRAGILIGPEFGTLTRSQITAAAREASDARFDALIACAFNFEAQASDLNRLGPLPILKARMNPDLHMAEDLKNTGKGNLFVVFGEPDVDLIETADGELQVKVNGVDIFDPSTGEIRSDDVKGIAAWFIDTDYNEESFFVRHAYFLGANDPYKSLKTALKAEIDQEAWETLYSDTSRPFLRPATGRIAVKVINHFGDEVLKVFGV
ncbi:site-specific DNA-methyltransferase [Oricola nitratireducens]|uniref:site-specific DNA-methyltransferase n=1 Tax=Oricola nitratireducens TaxID=2775868 RepID=UPI0018689A16|nr:site-specific DNA-methyltransferase [Oricola nitratireducens]